MHQPIPELLLEIIQDGAKGERKKNLIATRDYRIFTTFLLSGQEELKKQQTVQHSKVLFRFFFLSSPGSSSPFHLI